MAQDINEQKGITKQGAIRKKKEGKGSKDMVDKTLQMETIEGGLLSHLNDEPMTYNFDIVVLQQTKQRGNHT